MLSWCFDLKKKKKADARSTPQSISFDSVWSWQVDRYGSWLLRSSMFPLPLRDFELGITPRWMVRSTLQWCCETRTCSHKLSPRTTGLSVLAAGAMWSNGCKDHGPPALYFISYPGQQIRVLSCLWETISSSLIRGKCQKHQTVSVVRSQVNLQLIPPCLTLKSKPYLCEHF